MIEEQLIVIIFFVYMIKFLKNLREALLMLCKFLKEWPESITVKPQTHIFINYFFRQ